MSLMLAIIWRAAGLCLLLAMSACGQEPRYLPTAPTVPTVPSTPVGPTFTLSGVITERFSGRPVQGAGVSVWPFQAARWPPDGPALRYTPSVSAPVIEVCRLPK